LPFVRGKHARWHHVEGMPRFDDSADNPASPHVPDDRLPNKVVGQLRRTAWEAGSEEPPDIVCDVTRALQFSNLLRRLHGGPRGQSLVPPTPGYAH
jgi:hypothetical protein